jgi:murein DD-endopeptidase MepM/ murein hydrolase activator NlpD
MRAIVSGEVHVDSTMDKQAMVNVASNALLEASEREMAFRDSFEAQKVEELSIGIEKDKAVTNYLMHKPANGRIVETFNPHRNAYGLTLSADPNTSVSAILDGVVISCEYSLNDVYILVVQHPDNLTSVYKLHQPYIKKIGDKVNAGEILSTFLKDADTYFEFQLWKEGSPLDPQLFISF